MAGKQRKRGGRQSRTYRQQISGADASSTAPSGFVSEEYATESTAAGPPPTTNLGGTPPAGPPPGSSSRTKLAIGIATVVLAFAGFVAGVVLYVSGIKTSVAEQSVQLKNLEKKPRLAHSATGF
jgi:hypothetical protein